MPGLRILARSWMNREEGDLEMNVKIPDVCESYLDCQFSFIFLLVNTPATVTNPFYNSTRN